ncbi:MAG: hypothetical protein HYV26_22140 [Candidatus Hydrogenedentes bacterium]|nr:hypothetical protein [Candidatus Hydrogenedentota bacterium]
MFADRFGRLRLGRPALGVVSIEAVPLPYLRWLAWAGVAGFSLWGALSYSIAFLALPPVCILFEGHPCIRISNKRFEYGTSFLGLFLVDEVLPLCAIKDVRVQELRYRQWGLYRGPEDDHNAGARGANHAESYLVLDEGVAELKLRLGLSDEEYEWLADYLESFARTAELNQAA